MPLALPVPVGQWPVQTALAVPVRSHCRCQCPYGTRHDARSFYKAPPCRSHLLGPTWPPLASLPPSFAAASIKVPSRRRPRYCRCVACARTGAASATRRAAAALTLAAPPVAPFSRTQAFSRPTLRADGRCVCVVSRMGAVLGCGARTAPRNLAPPRPLSVPPRCPRAAPAPRSPAPPAASRYSTMIELSDGSMVVPVYFVMVSSVPLRPRRRQTLQGGFRAPTPPLALCPHPHPTPPPLSPPPPVC